MTNEQAKKMLKAKLECLKRETSGINHDCNMRLCDGCSLNYEQGNMGEQKEALETAIKALEQQPITWIVGKDNCQVAVRNMPIDKMQKICAIIGEEEQQPCEDCISRTEALKAIEEEKHDWGNTGFEAIDGCLEVVGNLPSVTPIIPDIENNFNLGYNCGYAEAMCDIAESEE